MVPVRRCGAINVDLEEYAGVSVNCIKIANVLVDGVNTSYGFDHDFQRCTQVRDDAIEMSTVPSAWAELGQRRRDDGGTLLN